MSRCPLAAIVAVFVTAVLAPAAAQADYVTTDVVVNTDPGKSTAVVNYMPPAVTGDGMIPMNVPDCTPAPGSTFPLGETAVTCSGMAQEPFCVPQPCVPLMVPEVGHFKVIVKDAEAPSIGDFPDVAAATAPGETLALVNYAVPTATDNVGVASTECVPVPNHSFPIGTTDVTCTAKDAAGNTATRTMHVTVTGTPAPPPPTSDPSLQNAPPTVSCVVPKLVGQKLATAKKRLKAAHCAAGKVTRKRGGKKGVVRKQSLRAGVKKAAGTKVNLTVGR